MNGIQNISTFEELKQNLNTELNKAAISFIRIGYLLKVARDTDILKDSGYTSVNDFAKHEYGLDASQVSRFMSINDRFAIGGYSEQLKIGYQEYGWSKLSLMLTLPDEINEELSPEMSKSDIQAIKEEYDEENKITDLEVMMEEKPEGEPDEFIALVVKHLNDEHTEAAELMNESIQLAKKHEIEVEPEDIKENYMPDGDKIYNIRIEGQGRFMISMKEDGITITNMRDPANKTPLTWEEFAKAVIEDVSHREFAIKPEKPKAEAKPNKPKPKKVEKSKPKKETVAPVQPENASNDNEIEQNDNEIEKVEGEVVETAMNPPENNEPEQQAEESSTEAAGESSEDRILEKLHDLLSATNCYMMRDRVQSMEEYHNYREQLDIVSEWIAEINNKINRLYGYLHERGN